MEELGKWMVKRHLIDLEAVADKDGIVTQKFMINIYNYVDINLI